MLKFLSFAILLLAHFAAYAMPNSVSEDSFLQPPEIETAAEVDESILEPQITIIHRPDAIIEEHRLNGQLIRVKIAPFFGPAYYLVDTNGDGLLDTSHFAVNEPLIPQWVLFRW